MYLKISISFFTSVSAVIKNDAIKINGNFTYNNKTINEVKVKVHRVEIWHEGIFVYFKINNKLKSGVLIQNGTQIDIKESYLRAINCEKQHKTIISNENIIIKTFDHLIQGIFKSKLETHLKKGISPKSLHINLKESNNFFRFLAD